MSRRTSVPILEPVEPMPDPVYAHYGSYEQLTVTLAMLESVNRKNSPTGQRRGGRNMYTNPAYRKAEEQAVETLQYQLAWLNQREVFWHITERDRYLIYCEFPFPTELKQDLHNPWKAICDCLQKAGVIWNDNRNLDEQNKQIVSRTRNWARISIYKFKNTTYVSIPFQALGDQYLQHYFTEKKSA